MGAVVGIVYEDVDGLDPIYLDYQFSIKVES